VNKRQTLLVALGIFLSAILLSRACLAPASKHVDEASNLLLRSSQFMMLRAQKLDAALARFSSPSLTGVSPSSTTPQAFLRDLLAKTSSEQAIQAIQALKTCLETTCDTKNSLARALKTSFANELQEKRIFLKEARTSRWYAELFLLMLLFVGAALVLWSLYQSERMPAHLQSSELEATLRARLEQLYQVRKRNRENARFAAFGEVAAGLSHGLKTPLACVRAATQVAQAKLESEHGAQKNLDDVLEQVDALVEQINRFLKTMGGGEPMLEAFDLPILLTALSKRYEQGVTEKTVAWSCQIQNEITSVYGEVALVEMALRNLIDNAFEASSNDMTVSLCVRQCKAPKRVGIDAMPPAQRLLSQEWVEFLITDEGPGIDDAVLRAERPKSSRPDGSGLGIALAKRIAARLGGALIMEAGPSAGTSARFILPPLPQNLPEHTPAPPTD